jgi:Zn-dependent protease with chaperone function
MNFFEHQALARRNTRVMTVMFLLAVIAVVAAVDAVIGAVYVAALEQPAVPIEVYAAGAAATAGLILIVSLVNVAKLAAGGEAVAALAGARRVAPETRDPLERRFLNIVEEMAIAAGVRVPAAYVMDGERGINAFAAGWSISNAVVAVTRGTLETLTRDELQGVIGHEFSHIVNGDMRLNVRMIGVLAGIVFIGSVGEFVMRSVRGSRDSKGAGGIFLAGLALFVIGYVGLFFARLIKAAVSRQREFLADASSVQFTRNPEAIAGALDQIRASGAGALIAGRHAEELSHLFFGQGIKVWLGALFDTHPPLGERILRVAPQFREADYRRRRTTAAVAAAAAPAGGKLRPAGRRAADLGTEWGRSAAQSVLLVGALQGGKIDYAARLLGALPPPLREGLREGNGAAAAILALLLAPEGDARLEQLAALKSAGLDSLAQHALGVAPLLRNPGAAFHLAIVDLALPAARSLPEEGKKRLLAALEAVIQADRRVSLHEFVVLALVRRQLAPTMRPETQGTKKIATLERDALALLSLVAHAGVRADATGERQKALEAAIAAGAKEMGIAPGSAAAPLSLEAADASLEALQNLAPLQKAVLVKGLFASVTHDGTIRIGEAELMRLVGAVLDCPLPPLLEAIDPATLEA